jgi:penicillin V acylase-like amidase (Ntn superfamily)
VGWRSFSSCCLGKGLRTAALAALVACAAAGCGRFAVRASEKEHLADRTMRFDADEHEAAAEDQVLTNREGATGGRGTSGGGCGCN